MPLFCRCIINVNILGMLGKAWRRANSRRRVKILLPSVWIIMKLGQLMSVTKKKEMNIEISNFSACLSANHAFRSFPKWVHLKIAK